MKDLSGPKIGILLVHSALVQTPVVPLSSSTTLLAFSTSSRPHNNLNGEMSGSRFPGSKRLKIYIPGALEGALSLAFGLHFLKQPFSRLVDWGKRRSRCGTWNKDTNRFHMYNLPIFPGQLRTLKINASSSIALGTVTNMLFSRYTQLSYSVLLLKGQQPVGEG